MERRLSQCQKDLFEPDPPPVVLGADDRHKLVLLVQALLREALSQRQPTGSEEAGDE